MGLRVNARCLLVAVVSSVAMSCAHPAAPPEVEWVHEGPEAADLERDREACKQRAAGTGTVSKRFDPVARGSVFMRCMNARGWRQAASGS